MDFSETLTRAKFEELNNDLFKGTLEPIQRVLEDADLTKREIDEIVPVGDPAGIPTVQSHFEGFPKGKDQERRGEIGDDMRCLYTKETMQRWALR